MVEVEDRRRVNESDRIYLRGLRADASLARFRAEKHRVAGKHLQADIQDDIAIEKELEAARFERERRQNSSGAVVRLTKQELATAKKKLKKFYRIKRTVSTGEVEAALELLTQPQRAELGAVVRELRAILSSGEHAIELP